MLKCFVFVLCAVTIVFCAPGFENSREKQSTRQDMTDQLNGASRTRRQSSGTVDIVYIDAASIDSTKLIDLESKESPRLAPVNAVTNAGQNYRQQSESNLELVSQNSNYAVYKLKSTGDSFVALNDLPDHKKPQASNNQYYNYDSEQYGGYSDRQLPPPQRPDDGEPPPQPPHHHPPPPPPHHHPPPQPPQHHPPAPHHHPPPSPPSPDDYRSNYYDRYYKRPPPPPRSSYDDRSRRFDDDRQTRQSPKDRPPPPPHRGGPPHGGPPPRHGGPPPRHGGPPPRHEGPPPRHGGPPPRHEGPPPRHGGPPPRHEGSPRHGGPPPRYDEPPHHHHGGPPDRFDDRPPPHHHGPPDRYDDRPPPHHRGPPNRYDDRPPPPHARPPYDRRPPPGRPPSDREQSYNQGNEYSQNDENPVKWIDATRASSTTEAGTDDQYQLDVRFNDDEPKVVAAMKRDVTVTTTPPLSPFIFQAAAVTPEN